MFKKESHIELSDGDTCIVSNKLCPLSEVEARNFGIIININDIEGVPCCTCYGFIDKQINVTCPHYFGYTNSEEKGEVFDCRNT